VTRLALLGYNAGFAGDQTLGQQIHFSDSEKVS